MNGMTPGEIVVGFVGLLFFAIFAIEILEIIDRKNDRNHDDNLDICASSEAIIVKDKLQSEFSKLVSRIAWHNARSGKDLHLLVRKEGETEEKVLISPEDMEKAFLEAAKLVTEKCAPANCSCKINCDKQTLLQRVQRLREKYEEKS